MTTLGAILTITDRLRSGFTALPLHEDDSIDWTPPPTGGARATFTAGPEVKASAGSNRVRFRQMLTATVETRWPSNRGDGPALAACETLKSLFRGRELTRLGETGFLMPHSVRDERVEDQKARDQGHIRFDVTFVFENTSYHTIA